MNKGEIQVPGDSAECGGDTRDPLLFRTQASEKNSRKQLMRVVVLVNCQRFISRSFFFFFFFYSSPDSSHTF